MYFELKSAIEEIKKLKRLKRKRARQKVIQNVQKMMLIELERKNRPVEIDEWIISYLEIIRKGKSCEERDLDKLTKEEEEAYLFSSWRVDFEERRELLLSFLSIQNIDRLNETKVEDMLQYSWAPPEWWSDKPWKAWDVLEKNGLSKFKKELKMILYGEDALEKRFDRFLKQIKGFGVDYITEILAFVFPDKYCLWNRVAADISILLGLNQSLPHNVWKYRMKMNGKDYVQCCQTLGAIKESLSKNHVESPNFLDVYHFMFCTYRYLKSHAPFVLKTIRNYSMKFK